MIKFLTTIILFIVYAIIVFPLLIVIGMVAIPFEWISKKNFLAKLGFGPLGQWNGGEKTRLNSPSQANSRTKHSSRKSIWLHVSSIGEWRTVLPLVKKIAKEHSGKDNASGWNIVLTYFNEDVREITESEEVQSLITAHAFMSVENVLAYRRWISQHHVKMLLVVETEFWPLMLLQSSILGVRTVLVSGMLFDKEYHRLKWLKPIVRPVLKSFDQLLVGHKASQEHLLQLGVPAERIVLTGTLKIDASAKLSNVNVVSVAKINAAKKVGKAGKKPAAINNAAAARKQANELKMLVDWSRGKDFFANVNANKKSSTKKSSESGPIVILWASVHLKEFRRVWKMLGPEMRQEKFSLILAPRLVEAERDDFWKFLRLTGGGSNGGGLDYIQRSQYGGAKMRAQLLTAEKNKKRKTYGRAVLLDTFGEVVPMLEHVDAAILGGTFVPVGGHNVLEPLRARIPTMLGPYCDHIRESVAAFRDNLIICEQVKDFPEALEALEKKYGERSNPRTAVARRKTADAIGKVFARLGGAVDRTYKELRPFLRED